MDLNIFLKTLEKVSVPNNFYKQFIVLTEDKKVELLLKMFIATADLSANNSQNIEQLRTIMREFNEHMDIIKPGNPITS